MVGLGGGGGAKVPVPGVLAHQPNGNDFRGFWPCQVILVAKSVEWAGKIQNDKKLDESTFVDVEKGQNKSKLGECSENFKITQKTTWLEQKKSGIG